MARPYRSRPVGLAAIGALILSAVVANAVPGRAAATAPQSPTTATVPATSVPSDTVPPDTVPPGTNLLRNPGAEAGARSVHGWDAVTIPGWRVAAGLPTVVRYGTKGFPAGGGAGRGRQLFVGGAGGTARLRQRIALSAGSGGRIGSGVSYDLSGWLGGSASSHADVSVRFLGGSGHRLASHSVRAVGGTAAHQASRPAHRRVVGTVPTGTRSVVVTVRLTTRLRNDNGFYSQVGYNRAIADGVHLSVSTAVRPPVRLVPPPVQVPRFDHVFLFYFENQDYRTIVGPHTKAPYLTSLLGRGSLLSQLYAEEHPSDGNYLALAGGSTFGIPLTDPLEENPHYTIKARNIGDLLVAAHESWKGYLQSANGPCDDTVHDTYWDDDLPFLYFKDIRERPSYCAQHMVPLASLTTDLKSAATTPSFSWVSPDDCYDMEGCGVAAGDRFLKTQLTRIMASPAWTTQRSLAIITFDEDASDLHHPAQRIPTVILGSQHVKSGYVSKTRYTHYSLLRTIEAALNLPTMTKNDRYAQATNDVFH
jgi:hypothetical protein